MYLPKRLINLWVIAHRLQNYKLFIREQLWSSVIWERDVKRKTRLKETPGKTELYLWLPLVVCSWHGRNHTKDHFDIQDLDLKEDETTFWHSQQPDLYMNYFVLIYLWAWKLFAVCSLLPRSCFYWKTSWCICCVQGKSLL